MFEESTFALRPQRQRLREEPAVLRTVDWRTLRTAAIEVETPGAGDPAPNASDASDASEPLLSKEEVLKDF